MKAVVVEAYDAIENIIRIQAASVGFVDGLKVRGLYQTKDPLPFTPGSEFAGVVDALAVDVKTLTVRTAVIGMARSGGLAEYVVVPAASVMSMPDGIAPEAAAPSNHDNTFCAGQDGRQNRLNLPYSRK
jgi:NADPH:quinone reductase